MPPFNSLMSHHHHCHHHLLFFQSIFSQLRLSPSLKKVLFATALGSVALALTAHHLKRRGRKRKQLGAKDAQKTVTIPELLRSGRPASLKRGQYTCFFQSSLSFSSISRQWNYQSHDRWISRAISDDVSYVSQHRSI